MSRVLLRKISQYIVRSRHIAACTQAVLLSSRCMYCAAAAQPEHIPLNHSSAPSRVRTMDASQEVLQQRFGWMKEHVPCFGMSGDNITVIQEPVDFYETFKHMIGGAKRRIVIASLYLGTGDLEKELVRTIEDACERAVASGNQEFEVHVLLDYNRGTRGGNKSSRSMLLPLVQKYGSHVRVYLYHTPDLRGLMKACMPERINETVGLTHMKIYLVDDDFIISGANLSDSYFTNRQDRYIQFRQCPDMALYLRDLVHTVGKISFNLTCNNDMKYPDNTPHPYEDSDHGQAYKDYAQEQVLEVNRRWKPQSTQQPCDINSPLHDTWLFPLIQMGPFNIKDDEVITEQLFQQSTIKDRIYLASGYFNLTSRYMNVVLNDSKGMFDILTAAPEANGFHGASGISGYVPAVYTLIAKHFLSHVHSQGQDKRISIHEYYRKHWTFHCKGLWYYIPESDLPVLTLIGSPNFGYRSVYRDLETQVAVVTSNKGLQQQLKQEHEHVYQRSLQVTEETFQHPQRAVPLIPRLVTGIIKNFF